MRRTPVHVADARAGDRSIRFYTRREVLVPGRNLVASTGPGVAVTSLAVVSLGVLVGTTVARSGSVSSLPVLGALAVGGAMIVLSLGPATLFVLWFALAPLFQESADANPRGHVLVLVLYVAPSLAFALWTLTSRARAVRPRFLDVLPLAYLVLVFASLVLTEHPSSTLVKNVYTSFGIGIVLYYFFAFGPIGSLNWTSITGVVLAVSVLEGLMAVIDGLTHWNLWHDTGWQGPGARAVATLANPAVLGTLLGMGIAIALSILVWNGPARLKPLAIATIAIGVPGLVLTYTRAPILATTVAVVVVLASRLQTRFVAIAALVLTTAVLVASWSRITATTTYRERVTNASNIQARLLIQGWSLKLAEERPFFGWGYGSFDRVKNASGFTSGTLPQSYGTTNTSHNTYLTALVEYGAVGLLLLVVPWLAIMWGAFKEALARPAVRWFAVGALAAIGVYVLTANANDFKYFSFVPAVAWILLGLLRRRQLTEV
jgi:O-antigen ligase